MPDTRKSLQMRTLNGKRGQNGANVGPSGYVGSRHRDPKPPSPARVPSASLRACPGPAEGAGATGRDRVPTWERMAEEE